MTACKRLLLLDIYFLLLLSLDWGNGFERRLSLSFVVFISYWLFEFASLCLSGDKCCAEGGQQDSGTHTLETAGQRGLGPELQH